MRDLQGAAKTSEAGLAYGSAGRRITADSFRLLTARLKTKDQIPDLFETPPAPVLDVPVVEAGFVPPGPAPSYANGPVEEPAEPPPPLHDSGSFALPDFVPLSDFQPALPASSHEPEPDASLEQAPLESQWTTEVPSESGEQVFPSAAESVLEIEPIEPDGAFTFADAPSPDEDVAIAPPIEASPDSAALDFAPPELASEVAVAEAIDVESPVEESFVDEPAVFEPPAPEVVAVAPPAELVQDAFSDPPPPVESFAASKPARAASPLAEKVVDALVKTITEAVYAKPSAAERAAFLREVAALVEADGTPPESVAPDTEVDPTTVAVQTKPAPADVSALAPEEPHTAAVSEPPGIGAAIADRLGSATSLLKKPDVKDPFSQAGKSSFKLPQAFDTAEADEDTGELALSLLDMMSGGNASSQPQERALAADTLLRLVPKIPVRQLLAIAERVSIMESPPSLLVARLIRDPRPEIAAPLLERCMHITDQDLALATAESDVHKLRMIARRRVLSPTLADQLIDRGDTSVVLTLVRNPGASFNHDSFFRLAEHAIAHQAVLAPLATRADLPAPVAFELFWHVPQELRRFIFSRFLTDSENLNRILKITMATEGEGTGNAEPKFPPREQLDEALAACARAALEEGAQLLADLAGIAPETTMRVIADRDGEPLIVLLKTLGYPRSKLTEALERLQRGEIQILRPDRQLDELQGIFDTLSFNKARILVTYWDWFVRKAGPYAPHN